MSDLFTAASIISLLTLTFLEIVLGIDNIIFISIAANKLAPQDQGKARNIGLILAMAFRLALLMGISLVISLSKPFTHIDAGWFKAAFTGQSLILFAGGLFLLYKATSEIHHKLEGGGEDTEASEVKGKATVSSVVTQIAITNIVFSIDSILTAIGLTQNVTIMMIAVILSVIIMMFFAGPVGKFVNEHPTIQMLGLAFLIMIGFMLVAEGAHLSEVVFFDQEIGTVPKGYLYFAIAFSLLVEFLNIRLRKADKPVQLRGYEGQPGRDGMI
ncbi:TerC family protein [Spirosoma utsteinense]|uniref:Tellurium resistance membrane protein TerC n=1 Tax=Spirosoma utsteinense TaxID=2585773 RepID=A0ABR6WBD0_9BACT|nr:TerC family protein [Spirosoma utsteinense]MBC3787661.1 putative tellurium resistance membrane protein TerC [Spirosoma utsteinense]MBC3793257.1 putative tellurium resistance membrane protein TerC [Spirosoma utsteinense]